MVRFDFWHRWLWCVSLGLVAFGVGMALLNRTLHLRPCQPSDRLRVLDRRDPS